MEKTKKVSIWNKTFTCAVLANSLLCLSQQVVGSLMSTFATFLGAGAVITGIVTGLYFGVAVAARPFSGPIITKSDKRIIMIFTYILGIITSTAYAFCASIPMFIAVRVLHGIEFAFVGSLSLTIVSESLPKDKMASGISVLGVGIALASAVGPNIGIAVFNWGSGIWGDKTAYTIIFALSAVLMVGALIPALLLPQNKPSREVLDSLGAWYRNIIDIHAILPAVLMCLLSMSCVLFSTYLVPLSREKGFSGIGLYYTVYAIILLIMRPICGRLVDEKGINKVLLPAAAGYIVAMVIVGSSTAIWQVFCAAFIAACSFGILNPAIMSLCMKCVPSEKGGVASNTQYFGMDMGNFLGPALGGIVVKYFGVGKMFMIGSVPTLILAVIFGFTWKHMKARIDYVESISRK